MKKHLLAVAILLSLLVLGAVAGRAQGPEGGETLLILLPVPKPQDVADGAETAEALTLRAAEPLLERLSQLEARGQVEGYALLVDRHAVRVEVADTEALRDLRSVEAVYAMNEEALACSADGSRAVDEVLQAARLGPMAEADTQATNPSVNAYYRGEYGGIWGNTEPGTPVQMVLKDASGAVKVTRSSTSYDSGYYSFYPDWQACVGYDWQPEPGDTVEVTAAGNTVSMVVADISAFADPDGDTVSGTTTANRSLKVWADATDADCDYGSQSAGTTSDGEGDFAVTLDEGFDRSVRLRVEVYDENENLTYTYVYPPHIELSSEGDPSGHLIPDVEYTAALMRGGDTVSSFSGTTTDEGSYSGSFAEKVQAGDIIEVSGGGEVVSMPFVALGDLSFDLTHDRITGHLEGAAAGRSVRVSMRHPSYVCQVGSSCLVNDVEANGDFTFDFGADGFDLQRGDVGHPKIFDGEGNHQELRGALVVPVVKVQSREQGIGGNWREPNVEVTVTLRNASGAVKATETDTTSSYDARFWVDFRSSSIEAGDSVDVTDGSHTLTVSSVPMLSAYLDSGDDTVNGAGPEKSTLDIRPGKFVVAPTYLSWSSWQCYTDTVSGGGYSVDLGDQLDIEARDRVAVYHTTSEGHKVSVRSYAFTVDAEKGSDYVEGYAPSPGTEVLVELWRGGSRQAAFTTTSSRDGTFSGNLSDGTSVTIAQGDTLRVKPEYLPAYDLSIPELTVAEDPAHNEVEGRAPTGAELKVELQQPAERNAWGVLTTADSDGDYVVDFDGVYGGADCTEAKVGLCTRPRTTYYNDEGHSVYVRGPEAVDVSADAFEPDDVYGQATTYTGLQSHTLHTDDDTDWISFAVTSDDVGTPYYLKTVDLSVNANISLTLYELQGDALHELGSDASDAPGGSEIAWTPSESGTYYVEVEPLGDSSAGDCGSIYGFFIARHRVYLPRVTRVE